MQNLKQDKQAGTLTLILILIALVLIVNLSIRPGLNKGRQSEAALEAAKMELQNLIDRVERLPKDLQVAEQRYTAELRNIDTIRQSFADARGSLIDNLSALADITGVELTNLRRINSTPDGNVTAEHSQMIVQGSFSNIVSFVRGIENMPRLASLSKLKLSNGNTLTLNSTLTIWSMDQKELK